MTIGRTLGFYIAHRFLKAVTGVLLGLSALVFILTFVETLRRASDVEGISSGTLAAIALFRTPVVIEQALPFGVLFGAMMTFMAMSRRSELVVARAAGISAWQFLAPALGTALVLGLAAAMAFNPLSAELKAKGEKLEIQIFGAKQGQGSKTGARWIRQRSEDGQAVIRASSSAERGLSLGGVTVFLFDPGGRFKERIEAKEARLENGFWILSSARIFAPGRQAEPHESYKIASNLTQTQVQQSFASAEAIPFWQLPGAISLALAAGLDASEYRLQFQTLLARPVMLIAMVLMAAAVSMRLFRFGGAGKMILSGIGAGFVLYILTKIAADVGAAGLVNPSAAAWAPAIAGLLVGVTVLLNQEDG